MNDEEIAVSQSDEETVEWEELTLQERYDYLYTYGYVARKALLDALNGYDAAGMPATQVVRGNLITAAMHLSQFKEPPSQYDDESPVEGPEDWFGVL